MRMDDYFGQYLFGNLIGPSETWFAWYPVKLWYGPRVWWQRIERRRLVKKGWLDGPHWECWVYARLRERGSSDAG